MIRYLVDILVRVDNWSFTKTLQGYALMKIIKLD